MGVDGAVALLAPGKLTGVALLKKREGQAQNVPDEAVAGQDIQLEAQAQKQRGLQESIKIRVRIGSAKPEMSVTRFRTNR